MMCRRVRTSRTMEIVTHYCRPTRGPTASGHFRSGVRDIHGKMVVIERGEGCKVEADAAKCEEWDWNEC